MGNLWDMTVEKREEACRKSIAARRERAELKRRIKTGEVSIEEALGCKCVDKMRVEQFIMGFPNIGAARCDAIKRLLHIADNRRVGGLGAKQRSGLVSIIEGGDYRNLA